MVAPRARAWALAVHVAQDSLAPLAGGPAARPLGRDLSRSSAVSTAPYRDVRSAKPVRDPRQARGRASGAIGISLARATSEPVAVILTGGEHVSVLAAVRALRAAGYAPWVAVHERGTYAARSRATAGIVTVPPPWDDEDGFVREIVAAAERIPAAVILPGTESGMVALARHAGDLPAGVALGTGPLSAIADATDKGRLGRFALEAGLLVPPTADLSLSAIPDTLPFPFPVVVKPRRSELRGGDGVVRHIGARHAASSQELRAALAALPGERGLVQPFMLGPLSSIAGVFWDDRMVCAVQSRGDRLWPPLCGSISHAETVSLDPRLSEAIGHLLRAVGWSGIFQVDFFERSGEFIVIDLNPRVYTSLSHATRAGLNLPGIWVDLLRGRRPDVPATYRVGVRYRHDEGDLRALARMMTHGPRMAALRGLMPHRDTALAIFSPSDPWPVMTSLSRLGRRLARIDGSARMEQRSQHTLGYDDAVSPTSSALPPDAVSSPGTSDARRGSGEPQPVSATGTR